MSGWSLWGQTLVKSCRFRSFPLFFPALRADAHELNGEIGKVESVRSPLGQRDAVQFGALQVHNLATSDADQVMMPMGLRVETGGRAGVVNSTDQSQLCQGVKDSIDRSPRNLRVQFLDRPENLVGSWVVVPLQKHLQHGSPLSGQG